MTKGANTRRYTEEFKRDAVALLTSSGKSIKQVATELGISDVTLGTWAKEERLRSAGADDEDAKEAARLRKRIKELQDEIEILKRFTSYWVKEGGR